MTGDDARLAPAPPPWREVFAGARGRLTTGLLLLEALVAIQILVVATVMPAVRDDLGGLQLYGWTFSASGLGQFARLIGRTVLPGGTVVGVEIDPAQLGRARELAAADGEDRLVDFRQGDAGALPLRPDEWQSFDLVHTRFVLEHVADPLSIVRQMVRAARPGEVVTAGDPLLTLIDPDDLWVRADLAESYIDRIKIGDTLTVRLPSGDEREGTVFYRGVDADFATQRDVSRTKRDIKTFEIRLRVDNTDRRLAVGMTAYVVLPTP